jgi:hypothetical protein
MLSHNNEKYKPLITAEIFLYSLSEYYSVYFWCQGESHMLQQSDDTNYCQKYRDVTFGKSRLFYSTLFIFGSSTEVI